MKSNLGFAMSTKTIRNESSKSNNGNTIADEKKQFESRFCSDRISAAISGLGCKPRCKPLTKSAEKRLIHSLKVAQFNFDHFHTKMGLCWDRLG